MSLRELSVSLCMLYFFFPLSPFFFLVSFDFLQQRPGSFSENFQNEIIDIVSDTLLFQNKLFHFPIESSSSTEFLLE